MSQRINLWMDRTIAVIVAGLLLVSARPAQAGPERRGDKQDDFPKFEDVTKEMDVKEGFFTLYYDKDGDTLLGRIPKAMLKEPFLISVSIPKGPTYAGWMLGGGAVYWDRHDKQLVLMEADTRYQQGKGSTVEDVIGRTYTDTIIKAIDIKTEAPGGDPVIDLGALLKSDLIDLGRFYDRRRMDKSLTRWSTFKAFPHNVELAVDAALMGDGPTESGIIASVHLSLSRLPKDHYKPREADDRIGYFLTAQKDWSADHREKTVFKRYIHRWDLQKQDPEAAQSPVKEPIVFYIEKTVPVQYRRWVRDGVLEWNKAFEKCGLLDAVQVRQQTETNEFKDLDPEDIRYNFIRWIVSGRAFARGPSRVNPYTGQILDADIIFDDSMVRFYVYEYELMGPSAYDMFTDPIADEFYDRNPQYRVESTAEARTPKFARRPYPFQKSATGDLPAGANHVGDRFDSRGLLGMGMEDEPLCELGRGMVHQLAFNQLVAALPMPDPQRAPTERSRDREGADPSQSRDRQGAETPPTGDLPAEFIGQVVKEIVTHEVGHTLGLRHNFKGSTWRKLSDILSVSSQPRALTGSIMDYNPTEYAAAAVEQGDFVSRTIGPYDIWAIEYGYRPFAPGGEHKSEPDMLASITARVAEDGLAYGTDEDTSDFGPDPYAFRYDNGQDPVVYAKHRMDLARRLMDDLADRAVDDGESYARLRRAFNIVVNEYAFAARVAARMVGGQAVHRDHKGDSQGRAPFEIVPVEKQREALALLGESVFSDEFFRFPPDVLNKLAPGRFLHWDSDQMDRDIDYDVHDRVLGVQARVLTLLVNPLTVNRIYDAELKIPADEDAFTVAELLDTLTTGIWSELNTDTGGRWTERKPRITSTRRNLQRAYLRRLITILLAEPGRGINADAYSLVRLTVKDLGMRIQRVLADSRDRLDTYTLAHLDEAGQRIEKVLSAEFIDAAAAGAVRTEGGRRGSGSPQDAGGGR